MYQLIDLSSWKRKDAFNRFLTFDNPTWDLLSEVSITTFYETVRETNQSFFLSMLYAISCVCNLIDELRYRIDRDGQIRLYEVVHPSSTILFENENYGYAYFDHHADYRSFMASAAHELEKQKKGMNMDTRDEDLGRIYCSPIPWVNFSGFRHPFKAKGNTSVPMIVFGKHFERSGERYMMVGLTLHHGLADGYHAGLFFNGLQSKLSNPDFIPR
jgi:chloramphenicol O-acetyltransferase type A